jgi:predicted aconitase
MPVGLEERDRSLLAGEDGAASQLAMRIVIAMAEATGAERLIDITRAHIDGCLYHGPVGLRFAERLAEGGGSVKVPTTLNVSALDLLHPELVRLQEPARSQARRQMAAYEQMGCLPTWTCAPYQLPDRPALGEQICWAESNAIVFANSVLGARTERYGDFMDICAALTGRVPAAGLHLDENRLATAVFRLRGFGPAAFEEEALYALLGHVIGRRTGTSVPAIEGVPSNATEDQLKAFGAAAASSGSVALAHVVGRTPEAATLADALGGRRPERTENVTPDDLRAAAAELTTASVPATAASLPATAAAASAMPATAATVLPLRAVSLGTPHLSLAGFARLLALLDGVRVHPDVRLYVSTGRDILREVQARGWLPHLDQAGIQIVVDTCTYITPILRDGGLAMTDSAKWAWYAPANLGVEVAFGTMAECVRSAVAGEVIRDLGWLDGR